MTTGTTRKADAPGGRVTTLSEAIRTHAAARPDAVALRLPDGGLTYGDLDRRADLLAAGLVAAGAEPGERVAFIGLASAATIALLVGTIRAGMTAVPLGPRLTAPEIAAALGECGPLLLVLDDPGKGAPVMTVAGSPPAGTGTIGLDILESMGAEAMLTGVIALPNLLASAAWRPPTVDSASPAIAVLTSGTTGHPKAALLSHAAMAASASAWSAALPPATGWLLTLGLAHVAGLGIVWRALDAGLPLTIVPDGDPAAVLGALGFDGAVGPGGGAVAFDGGAFDGGAFVLGRAVGAALGPVDPASHVSVVPVQLARLLDAAGALRRPDGAAVRPPTSLRAVLLGGAPIPPELVERAVAGGWPVVPTYGLTEAGSGVTALPTSEAAANPASAGEPLPSVELRIARPASDGVGEIEVRSSAAFSGYLSRPEATAAAFTPDGWLRTGDLGRLDTAGRLEVVDRRDDLLISGGENVYPAEMEAALAAHPAIADVGVVGRSDQTWGSVPVAVIAIRAGRADPGDDDLRAWCAARLASYKIPAAFVRVSALPRSSGGKLLRRDLRSRASGSAAGGRELLADDGVRLAYRVIDEGTSERAEPATNDRSGGEPPTAEPPILLLHATLSTSGQLGGLGRLLARDRRVLALDRRGSGRSRLAEPAPVDMARHVEDVAALLRAEGIERVDLVGHSFGGVVAVEAAARLPGVVRAVVAFEPPYGAVADEETQAAFARVAESTAAGFRAGGPAGAAEAFLEGVNGPGSWAGLSDRSRAFLAAEGGGAAVDASLPGLDPDALERISGPVTLLAGTASERFYRPIIERLASRIRGARIEVLNGLRHSSPITDPEPVAAAILAALAGPTGPEAAGTGAPATDTPPDAHAPPDTGGRAT